MKRCSECTAIKALTEFHRNKASKDGRVNKCKQCANLTMAIWAREHRNVKKVYEAQPPRPEGPPRVKKTKDEVKLSKIELQKKWSKDNPDKIKAIRQREYQKNKIRYRTANKLWLSNSDNKEKNDKYRQEWLSNNKVKLSSYRANYSALQAQAHGVCNSTQLNARIEYYGNACWVCGKSYEAIDHLIPLSRGGTNWPANLAPICKSHNSSKGAKTPIEFIEYLNKLALYLPHGEPP